MPVENRWSQFGQEQMEFLDDIDLLKIKDFEKHLLDYVDRHNPEIFKKIVEDKLLSPETAEKLAKVVRDAKSRYLFLK